MISENITKQEFVIQILQRDLKNIYKAQLAIARNSTYIEGKELNIKKYNNQKIGVQSRALLQSLENPDYVIQTSGDKFIVTGNIVKKMRFLDMKKYGNLRIYNRQVWGILYNNAYRDIRFNYGKAISDLLGEKLNEALNQQ